MSKEFAAYALEHVAIRGKFEEAIKKSEELILNAQAGKQQPQPVATLLSEATVEGWQKMRTLIEEWTKKRAEFEATIVLERKKLEDLKATHKSLLRQFHAVARPLRLAVAKEWSLAINDGLTKNYLRLHMLMQDPSGAKHYHLKCYDAGLRRLENSCFKVSLDGKALSSDFATSLDVEGNYSFAPFMDGLPDATQRAIICAMNDPDTESRFA